MESARVDRWLWAIRLCKTRSDAQDACRGGRVRVNGRTAKPASHVRVGDRVEAQLRGRPWILEVAEVIDARVGAPRAVECYVDHSPPPPPPEERIAVPARPRGSGRPTKRERRQLERWLGRMR